MRGDYEWVYTHTSQEFQKQVSLKNLVKLAVPFNEGVESYKLVSQITLEQGTRYVWMDEERKKAVTAFFDSRNVITGLLITKVTSFPETDQVFSKTRFILPFKGEWFTFWGGTNEAINYHYPYENQRYAYDFLILKNGKTFEGDKKKNESYYAFGQEVIAPADGTVVKVVNNVKDNEPVGKMNRFRPLGNYVVIDHGNGEYSLLAHFKKGSVVVQPGDRVKAGDLLGLCGNSGNSSEPHIHFQVMDSVDLNKAKSIRISFIGYDDIIQGYFVSNK